MGWRDKLKLPDLDLGSLKDKATEAAKGLLGTEEEKQTPQDTTDLQQLTDMLNDPQKGQMFEQQFGMDISGAKKNDGVVTQDETVTIVAKFSQKLVDKGYLKDVPSSEKKTYEAQLKAELGDDVDSYNQLNSAQKDSFLIFIATPDAQRQEAIQKAVTSGDLSYAPADNDGAQAKHDYVLVDPTGNVVQLHPQGTGKTTAHTEQATVPPWIDTDHPDIG